MTKITLPASTLAWGLGRVLHAAATDEARPILNTVLFTGTPDALVLATADNYRVAEQVLLLDDAQDGSAWGSAPIFLRDVRLLLAFLKPRKNSRVDLALQVRKQPKREDQVTLVVEHAGTRLQFTPVGGKWPKYQEVMMPALEGTTIRNDFLVDSAKALGKAAIMRVRPGPDPLKPVVVQSQDGYTEVIMPVRTAEDRP